MQLEITPEIAEQIEEVRKARNAYERERTLPANMRDVFSHAAALAEVSVELADSILDAYEQHEEPQPATPDIRDIAREHNFKLTNAVDYAGHVVDGISEAYWRNPELAAMEMDPFMEIEDVLVRYNSRGEVTLCFAHGKKTVPPTEPIYYR